MNKKIRKMTVVAMLSALSVVVMALGSIIDMFDLALSCVASVFVGYTLIEMNKKMAIAQWLVTGAVAFLVLPQKSPAFFFAFFLGYYPILKNILESHFSRKIVWLFKFITLHIGGEVCYLFFRLFLSDMVADLLWNWETLVLYLVCLPTFFLYDLVLSRLKLIYLVKWKQHLKIHY